MQRQTATYGPDVAIKVEVEESSQKLMANFVDDSRLVLVQGECKRMDLWIYNAGTRNVGEVWLLAGADDELWVNLDSNSAEPPSLGDHSFETMHSDNSLSPQKPVRIALDHPLTPGDNVEFSVVLHADRVSEHHLCLFFVFREAPGQAFHSARVIRHYEVTPIFEVSATTQPSRSSDYLFFLNMELDNISSSNTVQLTQVTTLSSLWQCAPVVSKML